MYTYQTLSKGEPEDLIIKHFAQLHVHFISLSNEYAAQAHAQRSIDFCRSLYPQILPVYKYIAGGKSPQNFGIMTKTNVFRYKLSSLSPHPNPKKGFFYLCWSSYFFLTGQWAHGRTCWESAGLGVLDWPPRGHLQLVQAILDCVLVWGTQKWRENFYFHFIESISFYSNNHVCYWCKNSFNLIL